MEDAECAFFEGFNEAIRDVVGGLPAIIARFSTVCSALPAPGPSGATCPESSANGPAFTASSGDGRLLVSGT